MSIWDNIDNELPEPVDCTPEAKLRTIDDELISYEEIVELGGGNLPDVQEWVEIDRTVTVVTLPEATCDLFSIVIDRIDVIKFAQGDKTLQLSLTGW